MKYKAVIFDLDGTLIDSMGVWFQVDVEYLSKRNIEVEENLFSQVEGGNSFIEIAQFFKKRFNLPDTLEEIMNEWTEMVAHHYKNNVKLKPGAFELIQYLKGKNIKLGIGTSNSKYLTEIVLKENDVLRYFDCIVAGCEEIKGKPFPDIFLKLASQLKVDASECIVIEDVLVGVKAAKKAGMKVYAIYDKYSKKEKTEISEIADFYADDFKEILEKFSRESVKL